MIENNPTIVSQAFDLSAVPRLLPAGRQATQPGVLLEEVEAEVDFVCGVRAEASEGRDYRKFEET